MQTIARGITYGDLMFLGHPRVIATAVLQGPAGVALVDPGPSTCLDTLRGMLREHGIAIGDEFTLYNSADVDAAEGGTASGRTG